MIESFVDLTYRGLSLGRRVKLTSVSAGTGYLETPAPMPVGTSIALATDEGLTLVAIVRAVHEQVGGSERVPGMLVAPGLDQAEHAAWWTARIAPEGPAAPAPDPVEPPRTLTVRPRSHTIPEPLVMATLSEDAAGGRTVAMSVVIPDEVAASEPEQVGATQVMDAVDPELLAQLLGPGGGGPIDNSPALREEAGRLPSDRVALATTGPHAVQDDSRATTVMDVINPASLGFDASGSFPVTDDEVDAGAGAEAEAEAAPSKKAASGAAKKPRNKKPR